MSRLRWRALFIYWMLFFGFLLIVGRAVQIQWKPNPQLVEFADAKSSWLTRKSKENFLKSRGAILDRNQKELAMSLMSKSFFANPRLVQNPDSVAYKLAKFLKMPAKKIRELLKQDRYFVWLKREVDEKTARKIENLEIQGIHFSKESKRVHPAGNLGQSVLGISGRDGTGLEGVEKAYDKWLLVADQGHDLGIRDALGRTLLFQDFEQQWFEGNDVVLTIDARLQRIVEQELQRTLTERKAASAQAVMMNPYTGEILAMASIDSKERAQPFRNRAVSDVFEPGSTFKLAVGIAALEKLHLTEKSQIFAENGQLKVGRNTIREFANSKYGWISLGEMLARSSNVAAAKLALRLGEKNLYEVIQQLGFGEKTGVDLPGEASGLLRSYRDWKPIDLANISFGQGIAVTPLQIVRAYSAIANGGYLVQPHVVSHVQKAGGGREKIWEFPESKKEVLSPEITRTMTAMLTQVTEEGSSGARAGIPGYSIAGKTGTAQKLVEVENSRGKKYKTYSSEKSVVSFVGYVPAENPAFTLFVMYDEPGHPASGGSVAAPSFKRIVEKSLGIIGISPERKRASSLQVSHSDQSLFIGKSFGEVLKEVRQWDDEKQKTVELFGYGKVVREEVEDEKIKVFFE